MNSKEFEQSIQRLKEISKQIDYNDINFMESMDLFEEGMKITKECRIYLNNAKLRIKNIVNENGDLKLIDFKEDDLS